MVSMCYLVYIILDYGVFHNILYKLYFTIDTFLNIVHFHESYDAYMV